MLNAIFLALNFLPGYKTKLGALTLVVVAASTAYNAVCASAFGLPTIPTEWLSDATVVGNAVLGVGVANRLVKA